MFRKSSMIVIAAVVGSMFASSTFAERSGLKASSTVSGRTQSSHIAPTGSPREVTYTFPNFNQVVFNEAGGGIDAESVLLTGLPAGTFSSYAVSVDWGSSVGTAWSSEAIWAFTSSPDIASASTIFYADPGAADDSFDDTLPANLNWAGPMDINYTAPGGPLYFVMGQVFGASGATWSNISITLSDFVAPPPTPPASIATSLGGSVSNPIAPSAVTWYSFNYGGTGAFTLDTLGSTLTANTFGSTNDTEIALYGSNGAVLATNDDANFSGGDYTSILTFADGDLAAGTYYLAVGGFNSTFANDFAASSTSISSGTIVVNGLSVVPEPTSLAMIALVGLATRRRR